MPLFNGGVKGGATDFYPYQIGQSLRFNDDNNARLEFTPSATETNQIMTVSFKVKRGNLGNQAGICGLFGVGSSVRDGFQFLSDDRLDWYFDLGASGKRVQTQAVFRDPSAWYHIVAVMDTTQASLTDRLKIWVNGELQSYTGSGIIQGYNTQYNTQVPHYIGFEPFAEYTDGLISDFEWIFGSALTSTDFGEFKNGVWISKKYTGSYGTNGSHLDFADSGNIGNDVSGNNNDWTPVNLIASDVVLDSPTNNWCTYNVLDATGGTITSEGNLAMFSNGVTGSGISSTFPITSGKYYVEFMPKDQGAGSTITHVGLTNLEDSSDFTGSLSFYRKDGAISGAPVGASYTSLDVIGMVIDADTNTVEYYKNGVLQGTDSGTAVSYPAKVIVMCDSVAGAHVVVNFGQDSTFAGSTTAGGNTDANNIGDFKYTVPTDALALCTYNLPEPAIGPNSGTIPSDHFNTILYTGTDITNAVTGVGFQSDLLWLKNRNYGTGTNHVLVDSIRGVINGLASNLTNADFSTAGNLNSIDIDGFTVDGTTHDYNFLNDSFVAWNWKMGNSGVINNDGTIQSTVNTNVTAGQSIVSYTGGGSGSDTVGTGLPKVELTIVKGRDTARDFWVAHKDISGNLQLNTAGTLITSAGTGGKLKDIPSLIGASLIEFVSGSSNVNNVNASGEKYIAYCFHSVEGYSDFGSYEGNSSAEGTFINCGFRPAYVMIKNVDASASWSVTDSKRSPDNLANEHLFPDDSLAEATGGAIDFLANGFKLRASSTTQNATGNTYIYAAFAENPFKYANAR